MSGAHMLQEKGIQRGTKAAIRNHKLQKVIDLKINQLELDSSNKTNEQLSDIQIVTHLAWSWRFSRMILHTNHILIA